MATLYDFKFDAEQDLDGVAGASGISLTCQVCKAVNPDTPPILLPAGNASVIREAVRDHRHGSLGHGVTQAVRESTYRDLEGRHVTNIHTGDTAPGANFIQAGIIHGDVGMA